MKYGLLYVTPIDKEKRRFVNIGDTMQSIAIREIYNEMNIPDSDIIPVELRDIDKYDGEYIILPININLSLNWIIDVFPLPQRIIPVFIGLSFFSANGLPTETVDYFRRYAPIGCRDEKTLSLMREYDIDAYLSGCVTMTMSREYSSDESIIFLVDVDPMVVDYIPNSIKSNCKIVELSHIYEAESVNDYRKLDEYTNGILEDYCKHAKLVITSRLHCISPCIALGINVIPLVENISPRMAWIDRFVKIYTYDELQKIEWKQSLFDIDIIKNRMREVIIERLRNTYAKYSHIMDLSIVFEDRERAQYGSLYIKELDKLASILPENFDYAIWGAGQIGMNFCEIIKQKYPSSNLIEVIDSFAEGKFNQVLIRKPDKLLYRKECIMFITTYSGKETAISKLEEVGYVLGKNCFCLASKNG